MSLWSVLSGGVGGYFSVYMVLGVALIAKALQESWLAAFRQHEALVVGGKTRRLSKLRFGFWSLMWAHLGSRWMYWLPGLVLIFVWWWRRHGPSFWSDSTDDIVDDSDVPALEPFDPSSPLSLHPAHPPPSKQPASSSAAPQTNPRAHKKPPSRHPPSTDNNQVRRRQEQRFQALLAHNTQCEQLSRPPKPHGWLVYDPLQGTLVVAATGQPAP
ncbi:hypothetical protein H257_16996 [Aphanomyces astaci]|uniref:Uncharacterized protein n=1 Tax=Aphanomyces astaci TaxID=112090 RepID=W4FID3_APHAT|nr:hypothetical protein H257_16996 [Aphanomyces astaci]ETV66561.1 hypothetical protein H257_16996 [Aphanomyces astaci]|eukprot:XP_009843932.1 hypothetical protein H257_16996 [Aphanomyces astaci]